MNEIIFFGRNEKRKLIKNEPEEIIKPIQFKFENENENENENQIKQISSSYYSIRTFVTIFLFVNGKAIEYLQENDSNQNPEKSKLKKIFKKVIKDIVSGSGRTYLLTSNQNAYQIGKIDKDPIFWGYQEIQLTDKPILMMKNVSKIFSGNSSNYVFLLNSNQELFGFGSNTNGSLAIDEESLFSETQMKRSVKIKNIPKGKIIDIKCGSVHSIMLIENQNQNPKRKLYSCGNYQFNGLGKNGNTYEFTEIKSSLFENDDNILDFSVGVNHTLILTSNSKLIGFGSNHYEISNYHLSCGVDNSFIYYFPPISNIEEDLIKLFQRKEFCDISFKTKNGEIIEAHKLILETIIGQDENQIEKLKEIISTKSIKESNEILEMIYSNRIINPKLYEEIEIEFNLFGSIEETMKELFEFENEKDFIIERKEKQYKFPKLILIMRSELYRGMFLSVTEDKSNKVTDYSELSDKSFQIFEYWIYSNQIKEEIQITQEIIDEIQKGIDYFQLNQTNPNLFDLLIKKFNNQNKN
ncbi:claret isoform a [Anaeramoeba ignava]|uniref:Claret isoform a n=1 Tax=Anaeramoeba ignava TaxID=1746090 RepID=A0A9Q0RCV8_ANAIG|nr:claret isoform a [Anaeramoeba ignava]